MHACYIRNVSIDIARYIPEFALMLRPNRRKRGQDGDDEEHPFFIPRPPKGASNPGHLPVRMWAIIMLLESVFKVHRNFDVADLFAGKCAVSKAYLRKGLSPVALDFSLDPRDVPWTAWPAARVGDDSTQQLGFKWIIITSSRKPIGLLKNQF